VAGQTDSTWIGRRHRQWTFVAGLIRNLVDGIGVTAGYNGYVGIEYEGHVLPERSRIQKSKELLD